jgi:hypothetical protein
VRGPFSGNGPLQNPLTGQMVEQFERGVRGKLLHEAGSAYQEKTTQETSRLHPGQFRIGHATDSFPISLLAFEIVHENEIFSSGQNRPGESRYCNLFEKPTLAAMFGRRNHAGQEHQIPRTKKHPGPVAPRLTGPLRDRPQPSSR